MKSLRRVMAVILSVIMVLGVMQVPYQASEVRAEGEDYWDISFWQDENSQYNSFSLPASKQTGYLNGISDISKDGYAFAGWKVEGSDVIMSSNDLRYYSFTKDTNVYAQWDEAYTVTVYSDKGYLNGYSENKEIYKYVKIGEQLGWISEPYGLDGYSFKGWRINNGDEIYSTNDLQYYVPEGQTTITAVWEEYQETYNITFEANGGFFYSNNSATITKKIEKGSNINNDVGVGKEGYAFKCWKNKKTNEMVNSLYDIVPTEDMTFVAQWVGTYQLTFESEYGYIYGYESNTSTTTENPIDKALYWSAPSVSGRPGYVFAGWSVKGTNTIVNTESYYPSGNMTFVANWTPGYKVTLLSNEGYFDGSQYNKKYEKTVVSGGLVDWFDEPSNRPGYSVSGWKIDSNGDGVGDGDILSYAEVRDYEVYSDITFVAQWTGSYTVTLSSPEGYINGSSFNKSISYEIEQGDRLGYISYSCYGRPGYAMVGWQIEGTDIVIKEGDSTSYLPQGDVVLNAVWEEAYTITFKSDSGYINGNSYQKEYSTQVAKGSSIKYGINCYGRSGYYFVGWKKEGTSSVIDYLNNYTPSGNETLIAVWDSSVKLTFKANGGKFGEGNGGGTTFTREVRKGKDINEWISGPYRDGYVFAGWKNDSTGEYTSGSSISGVFNANTSFTAQWSEAYTVTFESSEGYIQGSKAQKTAQIKVAKGDSIGRNSYEPYGRSHYIFSHWTLNGTKIDDIFSYVPTGNVTFKANWKKAINVMFDFNGGYVDDGPGGPRYNYTLQLAENSSIGYWPSTPEKDDLLFAGWKLSGDTSGTTYSNNEISNYVVGTEDVTFVAQYAPAVNVSFDPNGGFWYTGPGGGTSSEAKVYKYAANSKIDVRSGAPSIERNDVAFAGWKLSGDTSGKLYTNNDLSEYMVGDTDITFVAVWNEPVELTFDYNGGYTQGLGGVEETAYSIKFGKGGKPSNVYIVPMPKVQRHYFKGWQINKTGTIYSNDDIKNMNFDSDTTFYALWGTDGKIIRFESTEGYLGSQNTSVKSYEVYVKPGETLGYICPINSGDRWYRTGYEMSYFTRIGDGNNFSTEDIKNLVANSDMTFKANWTKLIKVTFDANGGSVYSGPGNPKTIDQYYKSGDRVSMYNPKYTGYTFMGWSERKSNGVVGSTYQTTSSYYASSDVTFTAIWKNNASGAIVNPSYMNKKASTVTPTAKNVVTKKPTAKKTTKPKYSNEWVKGKWYNKDGSQTYKGTMSWKSNSKGWWIEDSAGWYPTSTWQKIDGTWYYFKSDGYMASSEYYDGYWFNSDGSWDSQYYLTWKSNSTGWWVEDKSGWWPSNQWLKIDGSWYYFNGSGYMATSQYVGGYWVGANGVCQ